MSYEWELTAREELLAAGVAEEDLDDAIATLRQMMIDFYGLSTGV